MTADLDSPLASEAPAGPRARDGRTLVGRLLVAVLLVLGCMSAGGTTTGLESSPVSVPAMPAAIDELPMPTASESSLRHRVAVVRRRVRDAARRLGRGRMDDTRAADWRPVQFRLMPPLWRGPTVLRL